MVLKLYAHPDNYNAKKVLIAAQYAKLEIEKMACGGDQTSFGKMPVLETDQGCIFAANPIARYVARIRTDAGLYGQSFLESGMVDSWIEFIKHELEVPMNAWVYPVLGIIEEVPAATRQAKEDIKGALEVLNKHLLHNMYMVGHQITLADICGACALLDGLSLVMDADFRKPYPNVMRWFNTCIAQLEFKKVIGDLKLCGGADASATPAVTAPKKQEKQGKQAKEEKPKAEPKPKGKKGSPEEEKPAEKTPEQLAADRKAKMKKVIKEGGKRGVEIEGAADMGGLQFFCTSVEEPEGDMEMIEECMKAMNAKSDPTEEERKGGSGHIGKMIFSAGVDQLAFLGYVPDDKKKDLNCGEWVKHVAKIIGGEVVKDGATSACGIVKTDSNKGVFPLKVKDPGITEAINFLKKKGLFPDNDDDDDDYCFGDDDFPS